MKTLFKNLNFGALVVLISVVTLTVSWKNHESKKATPTWYSVTVTDLSDPNNPANQRIDAEYGGTPSGSCNTNPGIRCAVLLNDELNPADLPMTVDQAQDDGFTVDDHRQKQ
ncbi:hypothetical protein [Sphingobacterium thalpophilum]|uniref:hypothetical protein n=1 Tax=Sphingobacterium thalpophilum TaxID=259 RepID=UPI003C796797